MRTHKRMSNRFIKKSNHSLYTDGDNRSRKTSHEQSKNLLKRRFFDEINTFT